MRFFWISVSVYFVGLAIWQGWIIWISRNFQKQMPGGAPIPRYSAMLGIQVGKLGRYATHGSWISMLGALGAAFAAYITAP